MSRLAQLSGSEASGERRVFAYGFDAAGFLNCHGSVFDGRAGRIEFIDFYSPRSLEAADGVIIPQGIFEQIHSRPSTFGPHTDVIVDTTYLLERERQIFNLLRSGKWVCFLVGEIIDEVSQGMHLEPIRDTDLCKRILNAFKIGCRHKYHLYTGTHREVRAAEKEFELYARDYGTPTTVFELPHLDPIERHVIVEFGQQAVGIELDAQLFFLPFHSHRKDASAASLIAETVARSITQYRKNRVVALPAWADALKFKNEDELYLEINSLLERVNRLESQLLSWKDYKSILTTSGTHLRNKIIAILESVFDLKVEAKGNLESLTIVDHDRRPLLTVETRATEASAGKALIDEIGAQRQSSGLLDRTPAVLFINSEMGVHDVKTRAESTIPNEVVDHAKELNVLIVRTIDLLLLIQQLENDSQRGSKLTRLLLSGGGWLKMDIVDSGIVK